MSVATRNGGYASAGRGMYDMARCPVHDEAVGFYNGHLVGKCSGCASDCARGLRKLKALRRAA